MPARNWMLFLVAIGCAWVVGFFMGGPSGMSGAHDGLAAASGAQGSGAGAAMPSAVRSDSTLSQLESKSVYTFAERLRGISSNPSPRWRNAQFTRLVEETPVGEIPKLLEAVKALGGTDASQVTNLLFMRWATEDPRAAAEYAVREKNWHGATTAFAEWTALDHVAAVAWVNGVPAGMERNIVLAGIAPALARIDPARAFELLQQSPDQSSNGYYLSEAIARWATKDVTAALAAVEKLGPGHIRNSAMSALAGSWAKTDPQAALAWTLKIPNRDARRMALDATVRSWENFDADAIAAQARGLSDERDRNALLAGLVGATAQRDPERAFALLDEISTPDLRDGAAAAVVYGLIDADIERAAKLAETLAGRFGDQPISQVVQRLQYLDPERAANLSLKVTQASSNPIGGVFSNWLRSSPEAALAWIEKNKLPANAGWQARNGVARWAGENLAAATALVEERSGVSENLKWVVNAAIQGIATRDPQAAAEMVTGPAAGAIDPAALGAIGSNWAEKDPKAASQWLTRLPETAHLDSAARSVATAWANAEPGAAAAWIDGLPAGTLRDGATSAFASITARNDPEAALVWANTIQKEASRNSALNQVLRTWAERDPAAVKSWVASQPNLPRAALDNLPQ